MQLAGDPRPLLGDRLLGGALALEFGPGGTHGGLVGLLPADPQRRPEDQRRQGQQRREWEVGRIKRRLGEDREPHPSEGEPASDNGPPRIRQAAERVHGDDHGDRRHGGRAGRDAELEFDHENADHPDHGQQRGAAAPGERQGDEDRSGGADPAGTGDVGEPDLELTGNRDREGDQHVSSRRGRNRAQPLLDAFEHRGTLTPGDGPRICTEAEAGAHGSARRQRRKSARRAMTAAAAGSRFAGQRQTRARRHHED